MNTQVLKSRLAESSGKLMSELENAVVFRLFSDRAMPTLTVPEQIAAQIGDDVIKGRLEAGAPLNEQTLADKFQVSRGPVRDAIRILEREGMVTMYPRRGAVITNLTVEEVKEVFEIRAGLFEIVARKIAEHHTEDFMAMLEAGVQKLEELAALDDDRGLFAQTSYRLSILAVRNCNNRRLAHMLTSISLQTLRYSSIGFQSKARRQASAKLWRSGLIALQRGDSAAYIAIARERIERSAQEIVRRLSESSSESFPTHE
ncbi:GntR family transcriptional regulator [Paralcaligenes sp. KSB-10]|uniref:GntR family transcriptional regulator n=1 Tax=Paralcaligenes sp. KSB-10 TaxID=2901142 RepID=UPI001E5691FA|nr:GntR family transcriptional regulator [Paralcaligenes sp. KSB-10]UHL63150.1 GntR family transcriptional regulator [Paralcaligenes sp. KSB-10]